MTPHGRVQSAVEQLKQLGLYDDAESGKRGVDIAGCPECEVELRIDDWTVACDSGCDLDWLLAVNGSDPAGGHPFRTFDERWPGAGSRYAQMPFALREHRVALGLKPADFNLIEVWLHHIVEWPVAEVGTRRIKQLTGHGDGTIAKRSAVLERMGYVAIERGDRKERNRYSLQGLIDAVERLGEGASNQGHPSLEARIDGGVGEGRREARRELSSPKRRGSSRAPSQRQATSGAAR